MLVQFRTGSYVSGGLKYIWNKANVRNYEFLENWWVQGMIFWEAFLIDIAQLSHVTLLVDELLYELLSEQGIWSASQ